MICNIAYDVVIAHGHRNVKGTHKTTFEVTKDPMLTPRGDCIIAVSSDKGVADLSPELKSIIRSDNSLVIIVLITSDLKYDLVIAKGSKALTLQDGSKIVVRKSTFIGPETLAISSNKSARDLSRDLIESLKSEDTRLLMLIIGVQCNSPSRT